MFVPYAAERKKRMRRLRLSAQVATDMRVTLTPASKARRAAWFGAAMSDPLAAATALCRLVGPESMPAEGFEPAAIEHVRALS